MAHRNEPSDSSAKPFTSYRPVGEQDRSLLQSLSSSLAKTGALARPETEVEPVRAEAGFQELFAQAAAAAKHEAELNPDFHRPEVEAIVAAREAEEGDWDNPSLDGIDDYGNRVYDQSVTRAQRDRLRSEDEEDALDFVMRKSV